MDALKTAEKLRQEISKGESAIWAEGTKFKKDELECMYESYVVEYIENGQEFLGFSEWCERVVGISNT